MCFKYWNSAFSYPTAILIFTSVTGALILFSKYSKENGQHATPPVEQTPKKKKKTTTNIKERHEIVNTIKIDTLTSNFEKTRTCSNNPGTKLQTDDVGNIKSIISSDIKTEDKALMSRRSDEIANKRRQTRCINSSAGSKSNQNDQTIKYLDADGRKSTDHWNTAIFFPDRALNHQGETADLIAYLRCARVRVQLCLYRFSFVPLAKVLSHRIDNRDIARIPVQVIVDSDVYEDVAGRNGLLEELQKRDIPVRVKKSNGFMHHKFAIIDEQVVLTGSLNWTESALYENEEDVLITMNKAHVQKYMERFELLWNESTTAVPRKLPNHFFKCYDQN